MAHEPALVGLAAGVLHFNPTTASADPLYLEGFDDITTLSASGWVFKNNSSPVRDNWFQGNDAVFSAYEGADDSYIASSFNAAGFGGNISNWLITPEVLLTDGDQLHFYTRSAGAFPDRLEVRLSTNGASTNVGATDASVGDFTTLLLSINPALGASYPTDWSLYTVSLSGLSLPTQGRLAFRYSVGDTSTNADYIGIDSVAIVPEPGTLTLLGLGLLALAHKGRKMSAAARLRAKKGA